MRLTEETNRQDFIGAFVANMVADPRSKRVVLLDQLGERELLDLLVALAVKAKSIRSQHWEREGYLGNLQIVTAKLLEINRHRWGRDAGLSGKNLKGFEFRGGSEFDSSLDSRRDKPSGFGEPREDKRDV